MADDYLVSTLPFSSNSCGFDIGSSTMTLPSATFYPVILDLNFHVNLRIFLIFLGLAIKKARKKVV